MSDPGAGQVSGAAISFLPGAVAYHGFHVPSMLAEAEPGLSELAM